MEFWWVVWALGSGLLIATGTVLEVAPRAPSRVWERLRAGLRPSRGPWVQTGSGGRWYPFSPRSEDVCLQDFGAIAWINRWGGHAGRCTVAEHSVRVAELLKAWGCDEEIQLQGALHDVHEIYPPGDQAGPVYGGPLWFALPARWLSRAAESAVHRRLKLPEFFCDDVCRADRAVLSAEAHDRLPGGPAEGFREFLPAPPEQARGWAWDPEYAAHRWWSTIESLSRAVAARAMRGGNARRALVLMELERVARGEAIKLQQLTEITEVT